MTLRSDLDVSIVIVGWNSAHVILPCFRSMKVGTPNVRVEIVGVDNLSAGHSAPRIREILPKPRRTAHPEHPGNAGAVYLALDSPSPRRILLLDPDTLFSGEIAAVGHVPTIALFLTHGRIIADLESGDRPAPDPLQRTLGGFRSPSDMGRRSPDSGSGISGPGQAGLRPRLKNRRRFVDQGPPGRLRPGTAACSFPKAAMISSSPYSISPELRARYQ